MEFPRSPGFKGPPGSLLGLAGPLPREDRMIDITLGIDPLADARQKCAVYEATKGDRDGKHERKEGDPYVMNLLVQNAKRDRDNAIAANRRMLVLIPGGKA